MFVERSVLQDILVMIKPINVGYVKEVVLLVNFQLTIVILVALIMVMIILKLLASTLVWLFALMALTAIHQIIHASLVLTLHT